MQHFFASYGCLFKIILRFKYVPLAFDIYHLIFGDKSLRVLYLHIWNQVIKALKAELLPKYLKGQRVIGLDLSATAKLAAT